MNTKNCPKCNSEIPEDAAFCPVCFSVLTEAPVAPKAKKSFGKWKIILIILALLIFFTLSICIIVFSNNNGDADPTPAPTATVNATHTKAPVPTFSPVILPELAPSPGIEATATPLPGLLGNSTNIKPTPRPTIVPGTNNITPGFSPIVLPTAKPVQPTAVPTVKPTAKPTTAPTATPTLAPTDVPQVNEALWSYSGNTITKYNGTETQVTIPETLGGNKITVIGEKAFEYNNYIQKVYMPNTITTIGRCAFNCCKNLTYIKMSDSITEIESWCFQACSALTKIDLPTNLKRIHNWAFKGCTSLEDISFPDTLEEIDSEVFMKTGLREVTISKNLRIITSGAFADTPNLSRFVVHPENPYYQTHEDALYRKSVDWPSLYFYPMNKKDSSYTVLAGTKSIGNYAFYGNPYLKTVTLSDSVISISAYVFENCTSLAKINTNESLQSIANVAFRGCANLESLYLPPSVTSIQLNSTFTGCNKLVLEVKEGSYAHTFAIDNSLNFTLV